MKLSKSVVYLKENRERFCEVQFWDQKPCEKCIFVSTLNMFLTNRKYANCIMFLKIQCTKEN